MDGLTWVKILWKIRRRVCVKFLWKIITANEVWGYFPSGSAASFEMSVGQWDALTAKRLLWRQRQCRILQRAAEQNYTRILAKGSDDPPPFGSRQPSHSLSHQARAPFTKRTNVRSVTILRVFCPFKVTFSLFSSHFSGF